MILLTGAGGFIGSVILKCLNEQGVSDIIIVDDLASEIQYKNLIGKKFYKIVSINQGIDMVEYVDSVIHFGAITNTLEKNWENLYHKNVCYTRNLYNRALERECKFIFASSASVYGNGRGPENQYAFSKMISENEINQACILRLFNVYGPNEYHKDRMASVVYHWFNQLRKDKKIKIFKDSCQIYRDFVYVKDVAQIVCKFLGNFYPGIYDVGTGKPENFDKVADLCIENFGSGDKIYVDMPDDLKNQYQRYTQATNNLPFEYKFLSLDTNIRDYFSYLAHEIRI